MYVFDWGCIRIFNGWGSIQEWGSNNVNTVCLKAFLIIILSKYPIDALEKSEWYEWYIEAGILSHTYSKGQIIAFNLSHVLIHPGFNKRVPPRYDHDIAIIKV